MICVNSVSVYPKSISLKVGTWSYAAYAEVCPSNADCKEVQWHSDNSSVASVNSSSGYIYANGVGTTRIYADAVDGSGCFDYMTVTVSDAIFVTSVTLSQSTLSVNSGQSATLTATVNPASATNKNLSWTSSNNAVATVCGGVVTGVSGGMARITATATDGSGKSAYCTVYVTTTSILVSSVNIDPDKKSMYMGSSQYLYAIVCPENATNKNVTWSSTNPSVATVNPTSGLVSAQNPGTTVIRATAQDNSGAVGICELTVKPVLVQSISVNPSTLSLPKGTSGQLSATVYPSNATNKSVKWYSCDEDIATIDEDTGEVTAVGDAGETVRLWALSQDDTYIRGFCELSVLAPIPVSSITLSETKRELSKNETLALSATILPQNAFVEAITWHSSDSTVASVDSNGVVTAKKDGIALITATAGGKTSAACRIRIDSRPRVEILPDPDDDDFNIVRFVSSGKTWHCVDNDLLFSNADDYFLGVYDHLCERARLNCAVWNKQHQMYQNTEKTYTDDELLLLYAIDPHGVAFYVDWYSSNNPHADDSTTKWVYKNQIFQLFFNREPRYFARNIDGIWDQTFATPNYTSMLSESELYFGIHQVWDWETLILFSKVLLDVFILCVSTAIGNWACESVKTVTKWILYAFTVGEGIIENNSLNTVFSLSTEEALDNTSLNWVDAISNIYSACETLDDIATTLTMETNFYKDYIHYTTESTAYRVYLQMNKINGYPEYIEMADINEAIAALED